MSCLLAACGLPAWLHAAESVVLDASAPSPALGHPLEFSVYLPAGYDSRAPLRYPVLYLLHGRGDKRQDWLAVKPALDGLIARGEIEPLIVIMPDAPSSNRGGYYVDSQYHGDDKAPVPPGEAVETALTSDLIAYVDTHYATRPQRAQRIIGGYSMGGYGSIRLALAHPGLFGAALILSPAVYTPLPPVASSTRRFGAFGRGPQLFDESRYQECNYPALIPAFVSSGLDVRMFIAVGDDEAALADPAEAGHDLDLEAHKFYNVIRRVPGVKAELRVLNGGHGWDTWLPGFVEGVRHLLPQKAVPAGAAH